MPSERVINHLRELAQVARTLQEEETAPEAKVMMAKLAADYEASASRLEQKTSTDRQAEMGNDAGSRASDRG
jgi:DNA-binding ferritin-like protein